MEASKLKAARLLEQMSAHLATDAGKEIANKVGFVYQLNISPKGSTRGRRTRPSPSPTTTSSPSPAAS
ncbi:hypothetical protein ACQJBY_055846 [Aegilops geniculata]|uniref:Uncharacterized protein n=1 Tax=Triticum turgidum subsp. durum TaxID=4567 RepID=A0A9R1B3H5_TRITD|nr:unnamed protein product [Triticum turgidum subsp. durum]